MPAKATNNQLIPYNYNPWYLNLLRKNGGTTARANPFIALTKKGTTAGTNTGTTAKPKKTTVTVETAEQPKAAEPAKTTVTVETTAKAPKTTKRTAADKEKLKAQRAQRKINELKNMALTPENLAGIRTTTLLQIYNLKTGSNVTMADMKKAAGSSMSLVRSTLLEKLGQPRLKLRKRKKDPNAPKEPKTRATKRAEVLATKVLTPDLVKGVSTYELLKTFNIRTGKKLTMNDLKKAAGSNTRLIRSTLLENLGVTKPPRKITLKRAPARKVKFTMPKR